MTDRQVETTNDALRTVPGFTPGVTYLFIDSYSLRGFQTGSETSYQKYRDGRRSSQQVPIDPHALERIEMIKGPASVLYGQIEPGGLVNHITKRPLIGATTAAVQQEASSFGHYTTEIDANASRAGFGLRLPASFATGDSFRDEVKSDRYDLTPSVAWSDESTTVTLFGNIGRRRQTDDTIGRPVVDGEILDVPRDRFLGESGFTDTIDYHSLALEIDHEVDETVSVRSSAGYFASQTDVQYALNFPGTLNPGRQLPRLGGTDRDERDGWQVSGDLTVRFTTGAIRHEVVVGGDALWAERTDLVTIGFLPDINVDQPAYGGTVSDVPFLVFDRYASDIASRQAGVFIQERAILVEDRPAMHQISLLLGGRYDRSRDEFSASGTIFGATPAPATVDNKAFSPRAALLWMPIAELSTYASYAKSFNPQDAEAFVTSVNGNPDPTIGEQVEVGAKADLTPVLSASIAVYHLTKTNIATPSASDPLLTVLSGEARSRGIELAVDGELMPGWRIAGGFALNDTQVTEDEDPDVVGKDLIAAPKRTLGLWTSYTFRPGQRLRGLGGGIGVNAVGAVFNDSANAVGLPGYAAINAGAWYRGIRAGSATIDCSIHGKNLGDIHYVIAGNGFNAVENGAPLAVVGMVGIAF